MNYSVSDWRKAVAKLIQMTSKGELNWEALDDFAFDVWNDVDRAFSATNGDKCYIVADLRYKHFTDEDSYFWANRTALVINKVGIDDVRIAEAPRDLGAVNSLFSAVTESFAYSQNALDGLLD